MLKTAILLAPAPLTFTCTLPSVPAVTSTLLASEGGLVPCSSAKVVLALLTLILSVPIPVSFPSVSTNILPFLIEVGRFPEFV